MSKLSMLVTLSVLVWMAWPDYDRLLPCPDPQGANPLKQPECFLVSTYELARARFREAAVKAGARLDELLLPCGYTIDVAMLPGADDSKLLLHISGTHGVEGFVGSAIQTGYLTWLATQNKTNPSMRKSRTTIFVHGLNAFGMANWRRVNENNVDLNRNGHATQADLDEVLNRDPNIAGYETWTNEINPQHAPRFILDDVVFAFNLLKVLTISSISELKRALVSGTSTRPKGFMFVGREVQPSHLLLREYMTRNSVFDRVRDLILIDVHTGLGPFGNDTMILSNSELDGCKRLFGWEGSKLLDKELEWQAGFGCEAPSEKLRADAAASGYDLTKGLIVMTYPKLFPNLKSSVSVAQEFGTFGLPLVVGCIQRTRVTISTNKFAPGLQIYQGESSLSLRHV